MILNKKIQAILGMVFLTSNAFGQTSEEHLDKKIKEKCETKDYSATQLPVGLFVILLLLVQFGQKP